MPLHPLVDALAVVQFIFELALVGGTVRVDSETIAAASVHVPLALVLGQDSVSVPLAVIDLQPVAMANLLEVYLEVGSREQGNLRVLVLRHDLLGHTVQEGNLPVVHRSIGPGPKAFKFRCVELSHIK